MSARLNSSEAGFGLIEVLIALLVLSLGMLGVAAMQAVALRNSQSAFERSQAVVETYSILDAMRANRAAAIVSQYNLTDWTCDVPDVDDLVTRDIATWITSLKANINSTACGKIACSSLECVIEVRWNDSRGTAGEGQDLSEYTVETRTLL